MKKFLVFGFALALVLAWITDAEAITAWSRKYGADCSMCHWKQNKLNATGKEFLKRGHRMAGESGKAKEGGVWNNISDYVSLTEKIRVQSEQGSSRPGFYVEALALYSGGPSDDADFWIARIGQISPNLMHIYGTGGRLSISRPYVLESASFASNNPYAP